jgi:hypothetical protein
MSANDFFKELRRLKLKQPMLPLVIINCENSEFCDEVFNCKNLSYCFDTYQTTDSFYLFDSYMSANCGDCDYAIECELCYECVDPYKCFNSKYLEYCDTVRDSAYCYGCHNCNDIFGCVNLRNKSFCIFNRQLSEAEYREQIKRFENLAPEKILAAVDELKKRFPLTQTIGADNENTTYGNYIHFNKNCYMCFDAAYDEDCNYLYDSFYNKNSADLTYAGKNVDLSYQVTDSQGIFNSNYVMSSTDCQDSSYLVYCRNVKNSLGCVGLKNKEYCILNRQLTKEEYEKLSPKILETLKQANLDWANIVY